MEIGTGPVIGPLHWAIPIYSNTINTIWATYGPLIGPLRHPYTVYVQMYSPAPQSQSQSFFPAPRCRMLHFRSAWWSCSISLCCHCCCTIDVAVGHVALIPLLVWYAVPLFMHGMCMWTLLSSSSLPLSRWEGRDTKGPVWLFDHSNHHFLA